MELYIKVQGLVVNHTKYHQRGEIRGGASPPHMAIFIRIGKNVAAIE